ncbi:unnamed protein product [Notodromas monacha]|uniref:Uncharacterized protein n=1 Tax=Notodromas monacha TaxID=399045 RepID=A0A7R9BKU2_9CRUS|nr:unnamed protein product [Notodromas monacha]CAG0916494.1 unnamed protein product [Notodromas monacha]
MAYLECIGCTLLAFGPPLAMFLVTIASDPIRIIIMIVSAFFWLMSLLATGIVWFAVVPLRTTLEFGVVFSIIFQEVFRFLLYLVIRKAEKGLQMVADGHTILADNHRDMMAYVCGFGYGVMSGAFGFVNVVRDCWGPGTVGLRGNPIEFFPTSAALALSMILLHTCWGVIFFHSLTERRYVGVVAVVVSHFIVSGLTFLNSLTPPLYYITIPVAYVVLIIFAILSFRIAGGSIAGLSAAATRKPPTTLEVDAGDDSATVDNDDGGFRQRQMSRNASDEVVDPDSRRNRSSAAML